MPRYQEGSGNIDRKPRTRGRKTRAAVFLAGSGLAFAATAACGSSPSAPSGSGSAISSAPSESPSCVTGSAATGTPPAETGSITFNWLGANSKTVEVYPGPCDNSTDRIYDGEYNGGPPRPDTRPVACEVTDGRSVHSQPGEHPERQSSVWYLLKTPESSPQQWATAVYADPVGSIALCTSGQLANTQ